MHILRIKTITFKIWCYFYDLFYKGFYCLWCIGLTFINFTFFKLL
ncbi:hypothetical protein HMPREF9086_2972 [Enterobacter hormaechei ATCC 49162]|nr:hypothetical protein HMPREF9086_2972 [Enterobacter hormaechei ATCC 49162]